MCIKEGHVHCTAFLMPMGLYEYVVMTLGLTNAPTMFQRIMNQMFQDLLYKCVMVYLDDILVFLTPSSSTWLTSGKCLNGSVHLSLKQSIRNVNLVNIM